MNFWAISIVKTGYNPRCLYYNQLVHRQGFYIIIATYSIEISRSLRHEWLIKDETIKLVK